MNRGDVFMANLDPTIGAEVNKTRPVLIISNNANNKHSTIVTAIPITSNITKVYPFEVFLDKKESGLPKISKVQCNQIRSIDKNRIIKNRIGHLNNSLLQKVKAALLLHFGF